MPKKLTLPLSDEDIKNLKAGESVSPGTVVGVEFRQTAID